MTLARKEHNLSLCIDTTTRQKLAEAAAAEDLSLSAVIRRALRHELIELDRVAKVARDGKRRAAKRARRREAAIA